MTNNPTPDGVGTKDKASDPNAVITDLTTVALAVLVAGSLLDRFAGVDAAYILTRILAAPIIIITLVMGIRRRAGRALIWPAILLALVAANFVAEL